jgi:drug/metabolite transporter (DMT)-like permease
METKDSSHQLKVVLAFAAIYIIWGSTFFGVSIALKSFPPFMLSALRLLLGGIVLAALCLIRREDVPRTQDIFKNSLCGICMFVGGLVAVVWAQQFISSSLASIIITTPFWFVALDNRQWKFYFSSKWILTGLITGFIGVVLLLGFREGVSSTRNFEMQTIGILVMIFGSALWVIGALYLKYHPTKTSIYVSTSIQLLAAGIFCVLIISLTQNEFHYLSINNIRLDSTLALLYLSIASTVITFMAFVWLIKIKPPAIVSTYSYVNPIVAVLLGWGLGNEHLSVIQFVALGIILSGILFVNIPKYKTIS